MWKFGRWVPPTAAAVVVVVVAVLYLTSVTAAIQRRWGVLSSPSHPSTPSTHLPPRRPPLPYSPRHMEEAQSSYCCVASAYVVLPRAAAAAAAAAFAVVVRSSSSSSSDRCAFIDDDVFPRLVRHLYNFMCSTRPCNSIIYAFVYITYIIL